MKRALATSTALAVALVVGAAPDLAVAGDRASSTVSITKASVVPDGTFVKGKVTSGKASCKKSRKVKVFHDVDPLGPSADDFLLDTVTTNRYGKWRLTTPYAPDVVYATVKGNDECEGDTSPSEPVSGA